MIGPCLCGDPACPSCGGAMGTYGMDKRGYTHFEDELLARIEDLDVSAAMDMVAGLVDLHLEAIQALRDFPLITAQEAKELVDASNHMLGVNQEEQDGDIG
jgi:hypothetical protein